MQYFAQNAEEIPPKIKRWTDSSENQVGYLFIHWRPIRRYAVEFSLLAGIRFAAPALMAGNVVSQTCIQCYRVFSDIRKIFGRWFSCPVFFKV